MTKFTPVETNSFKSYINNTQIKVVCIDGYYKIQRCFAIHCFAGMMLS